MPRCGVVAGQLEHRGVQRVEPGERDELEAVAEVAERLAEARDRLVVEVALPVERRRAVVREELARELLVDRLPRTRAPRRDRASRSRTRAGRRTARRRAPREIAASIPSRTRKKPSGVRSPVTNGSSFSSMSLVSSDALSASVRATSERRHVERRRPRAAPRSASARTGSSGRAPCRRDGRTSSPPRADPRSGRRPRPTRSCPSSARRR